ncbi:hypothetical protein ACQKKK_11805 [Peribacillus sp. NPDC006672]|uniref:hypothetical protein n=1 Tax=Peribacillus sp. NPDC006672 TaxID=3390606 RepID=UPI003CFCC028
MLPNEPLDHIGRHFHNDFVLMVHNDSNFYLEVGQISYAALFSANWNTGMSFEIHVHLFHLYRGKVMNWQIAFESFYYPSSQESHGHASTGTWWQTVGM